jgi:hypothetical protein
MIISFKSSNRVQSLLAICLISAGVCGAQSVQAGPTLETTENTAIGAQATFNNSWAQTFEVKGDMTAPALLQPFALVGTLPALPNSGLAELIATVENLSADGGDLEAGASINPASLLSGGVITSTNPENIVLNSDPLTGLPALRISPGTTESSVIGASIIGTNIGTDTLQVTGSLGSSVLNTLTAF